MESFIGAFVLTLSVVLYISIRYWDTKIPPEIEPMETEPEPSRSPEGAAAHSHAR